MKTNPLLPAETLPETLPETWPHCKRISYPDLSNYPRCSLEKLAALLAQEWSEEEIHRFFDPWYQKARPDQWPPSQTKQGKPWHTWVFMGGRGAGKTRAGAEFIRGVALGLPGYAYKPASRIALIGETMTQVRDVMIEGVSGILSVHERKQDRPLWSPSRRRLEWHNGAIASVFSAEDPDSLRGPQFEYAWLDEFAKWPYAEEVFDILQFGLRCGDHPRQVITTTPRGLPFLRRLMEEEKTIVTHARTLDNKAYLSSFFLENIFSKYEGTFLGRQELEGEFIEENQENLWTPKILDMCRVERIPVLKKIIVSIDPPISSHKRSSSCGIIVAGVTQEENVYILKDATCSAVRPETWAQIAIGLYYSYQADRLVAEVNQGGEMVESIISAIDSTVPVEKVHAIKSKYIRAVPVAHLYEKKRVYHVGYFKELEDELCQFGPEKWSTRKSPDRLDALVWAVTSLVLTPQHPEPHIRFV